jgi:GNAT superfamily N-acetyltransferase
MSKIEVKPVNGIGSFLNFSKLPRLLYKGSKGFAPCLDAERWTLFGGKLNPHYALVDSQAWIASRDGKPAGRIFAQIYKNGVTPVGASSAQFGCLDAIEDDAVVKALIDAAETWLRQHGAQKIHGPFSPSVNSEAGMLVEGFDATPMIFMPWNPPYLPALLESHGYHKARDLISYRYKIGEKDHAEKPGIIDRPEWRDRLKIRNIDLKTIAKEAEILVDIFNDAWSENWGFVPFTYEEFMSTADGMKLIMPPEGGFIVDLDGVAQAFGVILPNLHEVAADLDGRLFPLGLPKLLLRLRNYTYKSGRLALFGVRKALQRKAVGGAVILAFIEECRRRSRGYAVEHVEFGWVLEDNMGMRRPIELAGAQIDKIHRIYEKDLAA